MNSFNPIMQGRTNNQSRNYFAPTFPRPNYPGTNIPIQMSDKPWGGVKQPWEPGYVSTAPAPQTGWHLVNGQMVSDTGASSWADAKFPEWATSGTGIQSDATSPLMTRQLFGQPSSAQDLSVKPQQTVSATKSIFEQPLMTEQMWNFFKPDIEGPSGKNPNKMSLDELILEASKNIKLPSKYGQINSYNTYLNSMNRYKDFKNNYDNINNAYLFLKSNFGQSLESRAGGANTFNVLFLNYLQNIARLGTGTPGDIVGSFFNWFEDEMNKRHRFVRKMPNKPLPPGPITRPPSLPPPAKIIFPDKSFPTSTP